MSHRSVVALALRRDRGVGVSVSRQQSVMVRVQIPKHGSLLALVANSSKETITPWIDVSPFGVASPVREAGEVDRGSE